MNLTDNIIIRDDFVWMLRGKWDLIYQIVKGKWVFYYYSRDSRDKRLPRKLKKKLINRLKWHIKTTQNSQLMGSMRENAGLKSSTHIYETETEPLIQSIML